MRRSAGLRPPSTLGDWLPQPLYRIGLGAPLQFMKRWTWPAVLLVLGSGCLAVEDPTVQAPPMIGAGPAYVWAHGNFTGQVSDVGTGFLQFGLSNSDCAIGFPVDRRAVELWINITTEGPRLQMSLEPTLTPAPISEELPCFVQESDAEGSDIHYHQEFPTAGNWTVGLARAEPGLGTVQYHVEVAELLKLD